VIAHGARETRVGGHERRIESFGQRHIDRVVRSEVVTKGPSAVEQGRSRVSRDGKLAKTLDRFRRSVRINDATPLETP